MILPPSFSSSHFLLKLITGAIKRQAGEWESKRTNHEDVVTSEAIIKIVNEKKDYNFSRSSS
jgi:hypothetical protein